MAKSSGMDMSSKAALSLVFILIAALGVSFVVQKANRSVVPMPTSTTEMNLNNNQGITGVNKDGTMGPATANGNWSNTLPANMRGLLSFRVTDPSSNGRDHQIIPLHVEATPSNTTGHVPGASGPQTVTALNLTISKVEVHIAYVGTPGQHATPAPSPAQQISHWETLNIVTPITVDLVKLAQTHAFSSLGITSLAAGQYTEVRLYVKSATATLQNGTTVNLTILGKDNIVRVVEPFIVSVGKTTTLIMDFDAQHSVIAAVGKYILKPVVAQFTQQ